MKKIYLFFIFSFFYTAMIFGVEPIHSLEEIKPVLDSLDRNSLLVLDYDYTLCVMKDQILRFITGGSIFSDAYSSEDRLFLHNSAKDFAKLMSHDDFKKLVFYSLDSFIEGCALQMIRDLLSRGVRVLILTSIDTRPIDRVFFPNAQFNNFVEKRYFELNRLGLDLSVSFPDIKRGMLFNKKSLFDGKRTGFPYLFGGVLGTGGNAKGVVLKEFIGWFQSTFNSAISRIVFVDDKLENCDEFEKTFKDSGREVKTFFYHFCNRSKVNREKIEYQLFMIQAQRIYLREDDINLEEILKNEAFKTWQSVQRVCENMENVSLLGIL
ncbi:TPA: hypothetical protein DEO28_00150 [Candidatus Dependentiae bacterium]|nr:MAG: hypothetical protein UR14_C0001G0112 [candidate division TM6 bacterium GW2011_GWE2_31_21]KKP54008.1 MAG: hypothetical protein UR43_C0001G0026 [candidate division TM6 bacterium GW2011_GWF2_33_332]HBS48411.1 hypothetical protein [Candidatus Dependentiae bacterium]HBZ72915.1 hypothetical protein [Candidatus Dependentiae bacterium]